MTACAFDVVDALVLSANASSPMIATVGADWPLVLAIRITSEGNMGARRNSRYIRITCKDDTGALVDAATITVRLRDPAGTTHVVEYGGLLAFWRVSLGTYCLLYTFDIAGEWIIRVEATRSSQHGTIYAATDDQSQKVSNTVFTLPAIGEVPSEAVTVNGETVTLSGEVITNANDVSILTSNSAPVLYNGAPVLIS